MWTNFPLFLLEILSRLILFIQSQAYSFWGWLALAVALIAVLDTTLGAVLLFLGDRPMSLHTEKQIYLRIVKDREAFDLRDALEKLQSDHVGVILKSVSILESTIPGIWPLVKRRLVSNGITSAYDVCPERLLALRWLGEVPLQSLLTWRAELEGIALKTMPRQLPAGQIAEIRARYDDLRRRIVEEGI
jgi:hypothetical protein